MYTLKVEDINGTVTELTHDPARWYVLSVQGLEPPASSIFTSESVEDGEYYNGAKAQKRNIVITLALNGDIEKRRTELYGIFPIKKKLVLYFCNKYRNVRITAIPETYVTDMFTAREQFQVSLICPSPRFEEVPQEGDGQSGSMTSVEKNFEFPFSIAPGSLAELSIIKTTPTTPGRVRVDNTGDIECGAVFRIKNSGSYGTAVFSLDIANETTGETFSLLTSIRNTPLLTSDFILTVDTRPGKLSVFRTNTSSGAVDNLIGTRVKGSKWLRAVPGANYFTVTNKNDIPLDMEVEITRLYAGV